jgi:uncharacterized protein involved in outer membrane biogenesis
VWPALAGLVAALLAALLAAFAAGAVLDLSRWRDAAAQRASAAIGRPVLLQGALQLTLGRELVLRVGELRLPSPSGFGALTFLSVADARVRIDLLDALRGRLRLRGIEAHDIGLWLERSADGRGNWSDAPPRDPATAPAAPDLGAIVLQRMAIHVHDVRSATRRTFELDTLHGHAAPDEALRLALRGRDESGAPYRLQVEGGTPRRLLDGAVPWPFKFDFGASRLWLHAGGEWHTGKGEARFDFDTHADDLAQAGRSWGLALPPSMAAALRGRVVATAQAVDLDVVEGRLAGAEMAGRLMFDLEGPRPRLKGRVHIDEFDLRPWLDAAGPRQPAGVDDLLRQPVPHFGRLPLDLDLGLEVQRWSGLPVELRDLSLELQADARGLRAPLRATVAGAALSGRLDLDTSATTPRLGLRLEAGDLALDDPAGPFAAPGLEVRLGRAELRLGGRGDTWGALVQDLELSLAGAALQLQHRSAADVRPVVIAIDRWMLAAGRGERLRGSASGTLNGERARLGVRTVRLGDLLRERLLPLEAELAMAPATLRIATVIAPPGAARELDLRLDLQAHRSGDLARWLPVSPQSSLPLALRARLRSADEAWAVDAATLQLGRSDLQIDAQRRLVDGRPLISARLRSRLIDAAELSTLRVGTPAASGGAFELPDAELDLQLQRVRLGRTELQDVALDAQTHEGRLLPVTAAGRVAGTPFTARAEFERVGDMPVAKLDLSTAAIDIGVLLRGLGVAQDIDGQADGLGLRLVVRGSSPSEWAQHADLEASLAGGRITVQGPAQRPLAEIGVKQAFIGAAAGAPIRGRVLGTIDELPLRIDLVTGSFADFARDASRLPFSMTARVADSRLSLDGEVALPLGREGQLIFDIGGERLDSLSGLARVELPAWGPWSLRGPIRMTPSGYELQDLSARVGQSRLGGSGRLDLSGPRPRLHMQVAAESIQLDDFPPPQRLIDEPVPGGSAAGLRASAGRLAGRTDRLLSAGFLRRFDANIDVQAREVLSGADRLADGRLHLELQQGRLNLDPALVNLPGGSLRLAMVYDLKGSQLDFELAAAVERFDYGIIARRQQRTADLRGLFSLDMKIKGTAPSLDTLLPHASGHLDVAVWPTELRSGVFSTWSSNLLLTLLPLIDPRKDPQLNCIVSRFDLQDGQLSAETLIIDTTSVRIRGAGQAHLATEQLGFVFRPRAKGLGLLRLQTPLRVGGTLYDQRFYFTESDVLDSVLRLIASPILLPIERLRYGPQPRDGADVCTDPLRTALR